MLIALSALAVLSNQTSNTTSANPGSWLGDWTRFAIWLCLIVGLTSTCVLWSSSNVFVSDRLPARTDGVEGAQALACKVDCLMSVTSRLRKVIHKALDARAKTDFAPDRRRGLCCEDTKALNLFTQLVSLLLKSWWLVFSCISLPGRQLCLPVETELPSALEDIATHLIQPLESRVIAIIVS